jgi:hypothetical protein
MSNVSPRDRLIGLQACAKAVRCEGQDVEETARLAIQLYDLLVANAVKPGVMPKKDALRYREPMTSEQRAGIGKLVQDNKLDRARFEKWMGAFFPEVREEGFPGLSSEHAARILAGTEKCVKLFSAAVAKDGAAPAVGAAQNNNG